MGESDICFPLWEKVENRKWKVDQDRAEEEKKESKKGGIRKEDMCSEKDRKMPV